MRIKQPKYAREIIQSFQFLILMYILFRFRFKGVTAKTIYLSSYKLDESCYKMIAQNIFK